ncbi:MAG: DUF58 domain-containing protein [Lautropia sp.]
MTRAASPRLFDTARRDTGAHRLADRIALAIGKRRAPIIGDHRLDRRVIYILPSRAGLLFGGAMATMLLAAINYSLALGYMLTFLLVAIGLVSMLHTYRNLAGLVLRPGRADPVHAGEVAEFSLTLLNRSRAMRYAIQIDVPGAAQPTIHDVAQSAESIARLALPAPARGWLAIPRLRVSTTFPLGLWCAWSYWQPAARVLVWPAAETPAVALPPSVQAEGDLSVRGPGEDDFDAIRPYREGDSLRRLAWKAMARMASDEPLTKTFEGSGGGELLLDWALLPAALSDEQRLSRLTRWVLQADASNRHYAVSLPGVMIEPGKGAAHRARCLQSLATWGLVAHERRQVRPAAARHESMAVQP